MMHLIKKIILCSVIVLLKTTEAEILGNDIASDQSSMIPAKLTTSLPIVLQLTTQHSAPEATFHITSIQAQSPPQSNDIGDDINSESHKNSQQSTEIDHIKSDKIHKTPNDVEVFEHKPGPSKQNQEEEDGENAAEDAEAPEEAAAEPDAEAEPEAEPEVAADPEAAPEEETEAEPEPAAEPEAEAEEKPEPAAEPETVDETPAQPEEPVGDDSAKDPQQDNTPEEEMQKDDPTVDNTEENKEPPATPAGGDSVAPAVTSPDDQQDNQPKTCYSCNSHEDVACNTKPTEQMNCKNVDGDMTRGHSGCYTIFKADSNMTMRGCVDELAEQGLRDCLTESKTCDLCYSNGCNNKSTPNEGTKPQMNLSFLIFFNGIAYALMKFL